MQGVDPLTWLRPLCTEATLLVRYPADVFEATRRALCTYRLAFESGWQQRRWNSAKIHESSALERGTFMANTAAGTHKCSKCGRSFGSEAEVRDHEKTCK